MNILGAVSLISQLTCSHCILAMPLYIKCSLYCRQEYELSGSTQRTGEPQCSSFAFFLDKGEKNPQRCSVSYNKKIHLYFSFFTHLRCHTRVDVTVCWPPLLSEFLLCMCVYFCVPWGQRSSSRCSDRSTVCGVLQHQQPDRGQTVDL